MLRQSIPWDLTRHAHQVSPHELLMGGISHIGSRNPNKTLHLRGTPRVPPQLKKSPLFPSSSRDEGPFTCFIGKGILGFPSHLKRRRSQLKIERNSRGHATITKEPHVSIHSRETWFPCNDSTVMPSINSKHDGRCDSPVAPREKAIDPYVNSTGSLALLLQLERKADLHVSIQDEAWFPCGTP